MYISDSSLLPFIAFHILYIIYYVYMVTTYYIAEVGMDQPGKVASPARGQLNRENWHFSCPRSLLRIWSRETGSTVPRVSLLILHSQAEFRAYSQDISRWRRPFIYTANCHRVSAEFYQATQLHADGIHCHEPAGTGPVVLKVVPVTGAVFSGITMDQLICASLFPHPLLVCICSENICDTAGSNII